MALLERAQRQHGLCSCEAPPLAFALHPVLDHRTARRLDDAGPHGQPHRQVRVVPHPAPMVVEERDDFPERLPYRLPQPLLGEDLSQAADDVAHPAAEYRRQLLLHPVSRLGCFSEQAVGRAPEVADDVHDVQHKGHALPRLEERGRQVPQAEGAIEQNDQGFAVLGISALRVGLDQLHHPLLRLYPAGEPTDLLGSGCIVRHVFALPARTSRFRLDQEFRERFGRPWLGIDGIADPHQRFLFPLPLLSRAQLGFDLTASSLIIGTPLPSKLTTRSAPALSSGGMGRCA